MFKTYKCTNKNYSEFRVYDADGSRLGGALLKITDRPKYGDLIKWNDKVWVVKEFSLGIPHIARGSLHLELKGRSP